MFTAYRFLSILEINVQFLFFFTEKSNNIDTICFSGKMKSVSPMIFPQ